VAEYQRTVAETVVDVFVAVHIPNPGTGGVVYAKFDTGAQASIGTLSAGNAAADTLKQLLRAFNVVFGHENLLNLYGFNNTDGHYLWW
jgi:hypothetical protein